MGRNDRQMSERPLASLDLEFFRNTKLEQMSNRRRENVLIAFKYSSCLANPPSAFATSAATDGFSAMINVLPIR
jgi:hypothetical protein